MANQDHPTFTELTRKRGALDRDVSHVIALADTIETRLRAADATIAAPNPRDLRSRGRKGPSDPTGGALVGAEDYATRMRSRWHEIILGHRAMPGPRGAAHVCSDLTAQVADGKLDTECLAGMVARTGEDLDHLPRHCRSCDRTTTLDRCTTAEPTRCANYGEPLAISEFGATNELANLLQDSWYLLYGSRHPDPMQLSTLARDLGHIRRRLAAIASDLRLWSAENHPAAANRCSCQGDGCNHTTRCSKPTDGARAQCGACRDAQYRRRHRATA